MAHFYGSGALNRFMNNCEMSWKHDIKAIETNYDKLNLPFIMATLVLLFYVVKVIVYFFYIFIDLFKGRDLVTYNYMAHPVNREEVSLTDILRHSPKEHSEIEKVYVSKEEPDELPKNVEAEIFMRYLLRQNQNILKGVVLNTKVRNIKGDELMQYATIGKLYEPAMKQNVSFGREVNEHLHNLIGNTVTFRRHKKDTYFVLPEGNYAPIEDRLNEIFQRDDIRINLTGC